MKEIIDWIHCPATSELNEAYEGYPKNKLDRKICCMLVNYKHTWTGLINNSKEIYYNKDVEELKKQIEKHFEKYGFTN